MTRILPGFVAPDEERIKMSVNTSQGRKETYSQAHYVVMCLSTAVLYSKLPLNNASIRCYILCCGYLEATCKPCIKPCLFHFPHIVLTSTLKECAHFLVMLTAYYMYTQFGELK